MSDLSLHKNNCFGYTLNSYHLIRSIDRKPFLLYTIEVEKCFLIQQNFDNFILHGYDTLHFFNVKKYNIRAVTLYRYSKVNHSFLGQTFCQYQNNENDHKME